MNSARHDRALAAATYLQDQAEKFPREFAQDIEIIKRNVKLQAG